MLNCPDCPDQGYYVQADRHGDPEQIQCEFCWTELKSIFFIKNNLGKDIPFKPIGPNVSEK